MATRRDLSNRDVETLGNMFEALRPEQRLRFIQDLTEDEALRAVLEELARGRDERRTALDIIIAKAKETRAVNPNSIAAEAHVKVFLGRTATALNALDPARAREPITYHRYERLRALGGGLFKYIGSSFADEIRRPHNERLEPGQVVRIGTVNLERRRAVMQPDIRLGESLAVATDGQSPVELAAHFKDGVQRLGVTGLDIGSIRILPPK